MSAELAGWGEAVLAPVGALRVLPLESLHVTVAFLGQVPDEDGPRVWRASRGAVEGAAPVFSSGEVVGVPRRRPRLLALDLEDDGGRSAVLADGVGAALAAEGLYEPEDRPFWPHVTLARAVRGARVKVPSGPGPALPPFSPPALVLMRSDLSPKGARYTALERVELAK